jgi:hypothetical protein
MKHEPVYASFPDLVAAAGAAHAAELTLDSAPPRRSEQCLTDISELLLTLLAELDIAATRLW